MLVKIKPKFHTINESNQWLFQEYLGESATVSFTSVWKCW